MAELWTKDQAERLVSIWDTASHAELEATFPGYTYNAIRKRASRMGLMARSVAVGKGQGSGRVFAQPVAPVAVGEEPELSEEEMLKRLQSLGYQLNKQKPLITDKVFDLDTARYTGELVRIGVVSDTHLCSKYQQLTHLKSCYQRFHDEGVKIVLHAGDLVEGIRMYRGWEQCVLFHGADKQAEYAAAEYPKHEGMTTYLISGNHDDSFRSNAGVDVCARVAALRPDLQYLGYAGAHLDLPGGMRAYLHHGMGGVAYSRSYKCQKAVENFAPETKPHLYISGHYHIAVTLPDYRNVFAMHPGCFQAQSDFLRRLGVCPDVGGWIMEYRVNPESEAFDLTEMSARWLPFRRAIPKDY